MEAVGPSGRLECGKRVGDRVYYSHEVLRPER